MGPHGQALVIYENIASPRRSRIYTALDPDGLGPKGFGRPRLLARTHVNATFRIPAQPTGITTDASLAWDTGGRFHGRVYAAWTQAPLHSSNTNIMFQYSGDNGNTWTTAIKLNDDHTANSQFFPAIAVDQATGDVAGPHLPPPQHSLCQGESGTRFEIPARAPGLVPGSWPSSWHRPYAQSECTVHAFVCICRLRQPHRDPTRLSRRWAHPVWDWVRAMASMSWGSLKSSEASIWGR